MEKNNKIMASSLPAAGEAGITGEWRTECPKISNEKCIAAKKNKLICQVCYIFCPEAVISKGTPPKIDLTYCKGCGICAEECPNSAITMENQ